MAVTQKEEYELTKYGKHLQYVTEKYYKKVAPPLVNEFFFGITARMLELYPKEARDKLLTQITEIANGATRPSDDYIVQLRQDNPDISQQSD